MSSLRQIAANRRNALKSTGPITAEGKERSRSNAVRHGLTAETVISNLEDQQDYQAFENSLTADYDAETVVERELVLRLASILWRLRRATGMETALFELAVEGCTSPDHQEHNQPLLRAVPASSVAEISQPSTDTKADIAGWFLRLMDQPTFAFDRLSRYEHVLWRQARQIVFTLESLRRRARQPSRLSFPFSSRRLRRGESVE